MSGTQLREEVRGRAGFRCEYCQLPERFAELRFQMDHVVPRQHGGTNIPENLALSCLRCNKRKGPNLTGIDSVSGQTARLFNPRSDDWHTHFRWDGPKLAGLTPTGWATVTVLQINHPDAIVVREALMEERVYPREDEADE